MLLDTSETLSALDDICLERQDLQIRYHPPLWYVGSSSQDYECCAYVGAMYTFLFRGDGKDSLFAPTSTFQPVSRFHITSIFEIEYAGRSIRWVDIARNWRDKVGLFLKAPNFRFVPSVQNGNKVLAPPLIELEDAFTSVLYINPETARKQVMERCMEEL